MSVVQVYRAFRTRCHVVYSREISNLAILSIEKATTPLIRCMLNVPTIFTKGATPALANELALLPFDESLDDLIVILEAYPSSYHHGSSPEYGVIISLNNEFKLRQKENQANWYYKHVTIVDKSDQKTWKITDLPKHRPKSTKYPTRIFPP